MALRLNRLLSLQTYSTSFVKWQRITHYIVSANQIHQQPVMKPDLSYSNSHSKQFVYSWNNESQPIGIDISILNNKPLPSDLLKDDNKIDSNTNRKSLDEASQSGRQSNPPGKSTRPPNLDKEKKRERLHDMKYFIEQFLPKFFDHNSTVKYLNPTMFVRNLIFENDTRGSNKTTVGYMKFNLRLQGYKLYYRASYMLKRILVLRVDIDEEMNLLDTTFRIVRHRSGRLPNSDSKDEPLSNEEWNNYFREFISKHSEWVDYRMIVHLTNTGTIWKIVLTKLTRRQSPAKIKPRLIDRFLSAWGRLKRSPVTACESADKR